MLIKPVKDEGNMKSGDGKRIRVVCQVSNSNSETILNKYEPGNPKDIIRFKNPDEFYSMHYNIPPRKQPGINIIPIFCPVNLCTPDSNFFNRLSIIIGF